jgi:glycosyltransferase involved in cell wall biosynthesis
MRVLHILAAGAAGGICGIRPSLQMLAESPLVQQHSFAMAGPREVGRAVIEFKPDLLVWHTASSWRGLPGLLRHRVRRTFLLEHHYCAGFERHNVTSLVRFRTMLRLSYACVQQVLAVSRAQRHWMEQARLLPAIPSGVLLSSRPVDDFLDLDMPPPADGRPLTLLAYGRFTPQKGFDWLLRALRHLHSADLKLLLVGDGPQRDELAALAAFDPRVTLLGASRDIPALLAQVDAVVIPSRWEPWGNVCLEARAAGRPVIVSAADGLPEQVGLSSAQDGLTSEGSCGLVVKGESDMALAAELDAFLSSSDRQRRRWSDAGRQAARLAWSDYLASWRALLDEPS